MKPSDTPKSKNRAKTRPKNQPGNQPEVDPTSAPQANSLKNASAAPVEISRRGVIAATLGVLGAAGGAAVLKYAQQPGPASPAPSASNEDPTPTPSTERLTLELPEKMDRKQAVQTLVENYNAWLKKSSNIGRKGAAVEVFVKMYNAIRERVKDANLPKLSPEIFETENIFAVLNSIEKVLSEDGYFVRLVPSGFDAGGNHGTYVAIVSGKIVEHQATQVEYDGKITKYHHVVIDKENPADSSDRYITATTDASAMTYQRTKNEPTTVLQMRWAYEQTARNRYERMMGNSTAPYAQAERLVLQKYRTMPREQAIKEIADRVMENSRVHETQHVHDPLPVEEESLKGANNSSPRLRISLEYRALLRAIASKDPKMGLLNVFMWKNTPGQNAMIGETTEQMLKFATGMDLQQLLQLPDDKLAQLAEQILQAGNENFQAALEANFDTKNPKARATDKEFAEKLRRIREAQNH